MARNRWTLALILICLPILATVITAFRVRDLPNTIPANLKTEKRQKCENCDVNESMVSSDKKESAKRSYEDLKKAVREKQQAIKQKTNSRPNYKFIDDSTDDDDDDDDDSEFLNRETGFKRDSKVKTIKSSLKPISFSINNDDDDDDDDDESPNANEIQKRLDVKKKADLRTKPSTKESVIKRPSSLKLDKGDVDDDDDEEDDDDEDDHINNNSKVLNNKKKSESTTKNDVKESRTKTSMSNINDDNADDDDNDEDDDDDDDNIFSGFIGKFKNILTTEKSLLKQDASDGEKEPVKKETAKVKEKEDIKIKEKKPEHKQKDIVKQESVVKSDSKSNPIKTEFKPPATKREPEESVKKPSEQLKVKTIVVKNEEKKDVKEYKIKDDAQKKESIKKIKEPEKLEVKPKPVQGLKDVKIKQNEEYSDKKSAIDSKGKGEKPKVVVKKTESDQKKQTEKDPGKTDKTSIEMLLGSQEFKSESNIKEVTDALQRRNLLQGEFEDFYAFFPTFAPNFSRIHNAECRRHGQILLRQLRGTKLWALNMLDATAKIPSGILQGNGIQLGDFDQCLGSHARVQLDTGSVVKVQGKYCLARLDVKAEHPELEGPVHLAQSKNLLKSRIDDPGHFVPRFSTLSWGVCVPAPCGPEDVEVVIKDAVKHYQHKSGVVIRVKVDEQDCHTEEADWWEAWFELPTVLTLSFYAVILLLVLVATVQDYVARRKSGEDSSTDESDENAECDQKDEEDKDVVTTKQAEGFVSAFSLYRTISKLVAPGTSDEIACIHGVRGIATIALLVVHKFLPVAVTPYTNRLKITEVVSSSLWSWCRAGWMYTDCFLLLSGALTAHRFSADGDNAAPKRLLSRYLRLSPALLAVVLFYAYIWDNVSTGPMWGSLVTKNAEVCQEGWWWNLLYVQNYFGFEDMCAPQTHQLALDMQLTILGGIVVWAMQSNQAAFRFLLPSIHILAAYSRYTTVRDHRLTLLAYHGVTVSQLYRTARLSYTSILHRCTAYLVGISLGLALRNSTELNKILLILGWLVSTALWTAVWWAGIDSGSTAYRYSATFAAQYAAFAPIASALAIAWVIYAVHNGNSGFLSRFLCCRPLVFISRLSYALYLCQFIVFLSNAATVRTSSEFTLMSLVEAQEISTILLSSVILTLTFVIPMQSLHKLFSFATKTDIQEETNETESRATEKKDLESETKIEDNEIEVPQIRSRQHLLAHREVLEEIPEVEIEFEMQRAKNEGLEEILEEEEDEIGEEEMENHIDEDDLEIIEEEEGGEDDFWVDREENAPRRMYSRAEDQDLDEWEWTTNGNERHGAQHFRYTR